MDALIDSVFALSPHVRYVAVSRVGFLASRGRAAIAVASASESERYEELLVTPTLLALAGRRDAGDCGGLAFLVVRYDQSFQVVYPAPGGHVTVSVEPTADPLAIAAGLGRILAIAW